MRYAVVLTYLLLMTAWIYGSADTGRDDIWLAPLVILAQVALGFGVGRWWALFLPLALVVIAVPAGVPDFRQAARGSQSAPGTGPPSASRR